MSDSGGGPARPECAAPVRWARGVTGGCEPSPDTQVVPVERTALCPRVQGAPRPVGRQVHRGDAEKRNAFKKSLKHLEEAEELDRLNPEVRRVAYSLGGGLGRLLRRYWPTPCPQRAWRAAGPPPGFSSCAPARCLSGHF